MKNLMSRRLLAGVAMVVMSVASMSAQAGAEKVYEARDNSFSSRLCAVAGNDGLAAAKRFTENNNMDFAWVKGAVLCNGMSIDALAKDADSGTVSARKVSLVASTANAETQLCLDALENHSLSQEKMRREPYASVRCNGLPVPDFVKKVRKHQH